MAMVKRNFWLKQIGSAWRERSIIWLSGVRRSGKTCLCQSLPDAVYFDCELPSVRQQIEDPETFLRSVQKKRVILDEIHRLPNPSEVLKIAADHFPAVKIIATGSSTLGASARFKDTLTGRKRELRLPPMIIEDLNDFGNTNLEHRFLFGGLPEFFLKNEIPERDYQEWMDAYWAKDIQEMFRLERKYSFCKFAELLFMQSGSMFEATRFAAPCEVSRSSITNYLSILEATYVVQVVRPFSSRKSSEIVSAPKVYGFDTGFVCFYRGWRNIRPDDNGTLWEHFVLNEMTARLPGSKILYWHNKNGSEIDFVIAGPRGNPTAIECKFSSRQFEPINLLAFRRRYQNGKNFVVCSDVVEPFDRRFNGQTVRFTSLSGLIKDLLSLLV
jgi:predicted AAA+ superfamily ATPase